MTDLLSAVWTLEEPPRWSALQWEQILGQARQAGLLARLGLFFQDQGWLEGVPPAQRQHLLSGLVLAQRQLREVRWEVYNLHKALLVHRIPVVLLKGAGYLMASLPPHRGRLFADVDIMVPREMLEHVEASLFGAGWMSDERDAYNQRYYRRWMHEVPPLRHVLRGTMVDLHHTIAPPTSRYRVDASKLFDLLVPLPDYQNLYVLSPVDMVLHSAMHLFQEGEFGNGLRDLLDLWDLLQHFERSPAFWPQLINRAWSLGLEVPLAHALRHLERIFGYRAPEAYTCEAAKMQPSWFCRNLLDWALAKALRPMHPSCDVRGAGLARWLLYVRSHALRMPPHLLVPHLVRKAWMRRFANINNASAR